MPSELATTLAASEEDRLLQAEALVRAYCGWHIAPVKTQTWVLGSWRGDSIILPTLRLVSVDAATNGLEPIDAAHYAWSADGVFRLARVGVYDPAQYPDASWEYTDYGIRGPLTTIGLHGGISDLRITARHGFDQVPAEVTAVVQAAAQRAFDNPHSIVREQVGPFGTTYAQPGFNQAQPLVLLDAEKSILGRYRLPPRP